MTGLIGPNGSGKSTLFHLITGFYPLDKGRIVFNGRRVGGAGINPTLVSALSHIIRDLSSRGIQVFLIEHNMQFVTRLCRRIYVMDSGSLIFSGTPGQVRKNEQVIEAYLGRTAHECLSDLTVYENLEIAGALVKDRQRLHRAIESACETFPVLAGNRNRPARVLSGPGRELLDNPELQKLYLGG